MKLEDRSVEITQIISQRKKTMKKRHGKENKKFKHTLGYANIRELWYKGDIKRI